MTEDELRALVSGNRENGFRLLFQQYQSYVYSVVWSHIKAVCTKEDAEECVSDAFAAVFLHYDEIREGALQGYIGTVAKRTAIDMFRRHTAKKAASFTVEELPEIQKYYYDRNTDEIASAVDLKPVTVRVRLSRALKRLKTLLADSGFSL